MIHIVLPVFNALDALEACVESLWRHTPGPARLTLLDDASTDPRIADFLDHLARRPRPPGLDLAIRRNPRNLGFTANVNQALREGREDLVLLNSDTEVTAGWLAALQRAAASRPEVASVTPWSNHAEICSWPTLCRETPLAAGEGEAIAAVIGAEPARGWPELPTAVGFCMLIRRAALDAVGAFDEQAFPRGYGEENDWCCRATQAGFVHLLAPDAFVVHRGGRSFLDESPGLKARHGTVLGTRHPDYAARVARFIAEDPLAPWRARLDAAFAARSLDALGRPLRPGLLLVSHALGGGVAQHVEDLMALMAPQARVELLQPAGPGRLVLRDAAGDRVELADEDPEALRRLLQARRYARVHLHHTAGLPPAALAAVESLGLPLDLTLHDFAAYCPQHNLSTAEGRPCGEPDLAGCEACVQARPHPWGLTVAAWRAGWGARLRRAERVWVPSATVQRKVSAHHPGVPLAIRPHPPRAAWLATPPRPRVVLVLGGLSAPKGLHRLRAAAAAARFEARALHFLVLGYLGEALPLAPELPLERSGEYRDEDLPALLAGRRVDAVWFPTLAPETHSYTLDAALALDRPLLASAGAGAIAERLARLDDGRGVLLDDADGGLGPLFAALEARLGPEVAAGGARRETDPAGRAVREAARQAYAAELGAPLAADGPPPRLAPLSALREAPPAPPAEGLRRPLAQLFEHGVDAGHRASREALRRRVVEADAVEAALRAAAAPTGRPWFEALDATRQQAEAAQRQAEAAQGQAEQAAADLRRALAALQAGEAREQHAREVLAAMDSDLAQARQQAAASAAALHALREAHPIRRLMRFARRLRHLASRLPLAWTLLHREGPRALARRVRAKLRRPRFEPPTRAWQEVQLAPVGPLRLATCPAEATPRLSIIIPVYGQHEHTFNALRSLQQHTALDGVEVVVVDDASPSPARVAMAQVEGVVWHRVAENGGFIRACHAGVARARGARLLFLNNDVQVTPGWLEALEAALALPRVGLVGAKLVYPDGRLQEAGGIVWRDGSAWNWGRLGDPDAPGFNYLRDADYCSGACLLIERSLWEATGGFDLAYAPAYYEDADLAFQVRARGLRVVYQPAATVVHFEGITSGTDLAAGAKRHQVINRETFEARWRTVLAGHRPNAEAPLRELHRAARRRVLVVDACMLRPDMDAGSVRMEALLQEMVGLGCATTFIAANLEHRQPYVSALQQAGVEVLHLPYVRSVESVLEARGTDFDVVLLSRHYIAAPLIEAVRRHAPQARLWFDTVDLHFLREERLAAVEGSPSLVRMAEATRKAELDVIRRSDLTLVVSPYEREVLARLMPAAAVDVLSLVHEPVDDTPPFARREGLLFVGGFQHPPNVDAIVWFLENVWPLIQARAPGLVLQVAGSNMPEALHRLASDTVRMLGQVPRVEPLLDGVRVSIAPLRYGAGVKGKINQAMALGVPVVATSVAAEGMGLADGEDVLIADSPQAFAEQVLRAHEDAALWARLAEGGRANVRRHFSRAVARGTLSRLLGLG